MQVEDCENEHPILTHREEDAVREAHQTDTAADIRKLERVVADSADQTFEAIKETQAEARPLALVPQR